MIICVTKPFGWQSCLWICKATELFMFGNYFIKLAIVPTTAIAHTDPPALKTQQKW